MQTINRMYMITTRNKLNLFESHSLNQKKNRMQVQQAQSKHERVREMKEKAEKELRQIRTQMKKNKENERLVIKNNSIQYDEAIKKNKRLEIQKKQQLVKEMKQQKEKYKESIMNSRLFEYLFIYQGNSRNKSSCLIAQWLRQNGSLRLQRNWIG